MTARELRAATGSVGLGWEAIIAAALRESAAEAFEEAAKIVKDQPKATGYLTRYFNLKAISLRSTTRGKR